jgi:hypothetical protein
MRQSGREGMSLIAFPNHPRLNPWAEVNQTPLKRGFQKKLPSGRFALNQPPGLAGGEK